MRSERCGGSLRKWTWACFAPRLAGCCKPRLQRGIRDTFVRALCGPGPAQTGKAGPSDDAPSEKALLRERRLGDLNPGWARTQTALAESLRGCREQMRIVGIAQTRRSARPGRAGFRQARR